MKKDLRYQDCMFKLTNKLPKWATTVTPFTKMLALSMLVVFPVLAFFLGRAYQKVITPKPIVMYETLAEQNKALKDIICK